MQEIELKEALLAAYERLLRPLVRILLRNGIGFTDFSEVARDVFVDVAVKDLGPSAKKVTRARIAILTGLTRTEVTRVLERQEHRSKETPSNLARVMKILSGWHTDPDFTGPYGLPLDLPYSAGSGRSFADLTRRYAAEVSTRSMLYDLLRMGVVKETDRGSFKVLTRTYMPKVDAPDSLERLSLAVRNFIETIDHNRIETDPERKLFERAVVADDGIRPEDLPRFQAYLRERGQLLLEELDDWLSQLEKPNADDESIVIQTGVGIYQYVSKEH